MLQHLVSCNITVSQNCCEFRDVALVRQVHVLCSVWLLQKSTGHPALCDPVHEVLTPLLSLATLYFSKPCNVINQCLALAKSFARGVGIEFQEHSTSYHCSTSPCIGEEHGWIVRFRTVMQNVWWCPWSLFLVEFLGSKSRKAMSLQGLFSDLSLWMDNFCTHA